MKLVDDTGTERDFFFEISKYSAFLYKSHIERHLALYDLYKKTVELPGSVAEFGLYNGSTFYFLARLIEIFHGSQSERHSSTSHHLYGFEIFEGIGALHENDDILNPTNQKNQRVLFKIKNCFLGTWSFLRIIPVSPRGCMSLMVMFVPPFRNFSRKTRVSDFDLF